MGLNRFLSREKDVFEEDATVRVVVVKVSLKCAGISAEREDKTRT